MSRLIRLRALRHSSSPSLTLARPYSSTFEPHPSPPRLPADQQAEFERLQREAEARLSTHTSSPPQQQQPLQTSRHTTTPSAQENRPSPARVNQVATPGEIGLSGGIRQGAPPEFEGDKNPKTGEI